MKEPLKKTIRPTPTRMRVVPIIGFGTNTLFSAS
jgi:hypothetical protein